MEDIMDTTRLRQLLDQRDKVDLDILALVTSAGIKDRRPQVCSICQRTRASR